MAHSEFDIDLDRITIREYRALFSPQQTAAEETAVLAKAAGMTTDEVLELSVLDYMRLVKAVIHKFREPLADPL